MSEAIKCCSSTVHQNRQKLREKVGRHRANKNKKRPNSKQKVPKQKQPHGGMTATGKKTPPGGTKKHHWLVILCRQQIVLNSSVKARDNV